MRIPGRQTTRRKRWSSSWGGLEAYAALREVVGDPLPSAQTVRLNEIVERWRDPVDPALTRLTAQGGSRRDWLAALRSGTQSVRDGMTACHYHVARIEQIENEVIAFCERRDGLFPEGRDTSFRIPPLSAEYAALQFALRRTLDYTAVAVAAFFKTHGGSFRHLGRTVDGREPTDCSNAVKSRLDDADLSSVLGTEQGHSVRDQLAHQQAVELAWFGVQRFQGELMIRYMSEVEDVANDNFLTTPRRGRDLSEATRKSSLGWRKSYLASTPIWASCPSRGANPLAGFTRRATPLVFSWRGAQIVEHIEKQRISR